MAPRYRAPDDDRAPETDGGEAGPRPLKSRRLLDVMEGGSRGKADPADSCPRSAGKPAPSSNPQSSPKPPKRRASDASFSVWTINSDLPEAAPPVAAVPEEPPSAVMGSADTFAILSVTPEGEGETVAVVLSVPASEVGGITAGKEAPANGAPVRIKLHLLVEQYADLRPTVGELTPEQADALAEAGRLCAAIRRGIALLGYGDPSARRLAYKLTAKGIDRETASAAVAYLVDKGYIREDNAATLRAEQGCRKGWGPRRIREDLCAHGFTREAVEEAMTSLSDVDWVEACADVIRKKHGEIPEDRGARQKLIAAVMRLGYDADTVREAMRIILREP